MKQRSWIELGVEGISAPFVGLSCTIDERVGAPFVARFHYEVLENSQHASVLSLDMLGQPAWLVLSLGGEERRFEGIVDRVEDHEGHSEIVLVARVAETADGRAYRVFPGASAVEVAGDPRSAGLPRRGPRAERAAPASAMAAIVRE
jgi:type VI secretion system secreted protein VgrG